MKIITRISEYIHYRKKGYSKGKAWQLAGTSFYWYQRGYR